MTTRYVIVDPEWGIYLGSALGMGFWSKLDPVGQTCAATFGSPVAALDWINTWESSRDRHYSFHAVRPDTQLHVSIKGCVAAGLDAWDPHATLISLDGANLEVKPLVHVEPPEHLDISLAPKHSHLS